MKIVHETTKYDSFKKLLGNRAVSEMRKRQIRESILAVGYITSPLVVNEKLEVIDGQGRLAVLEELGLPVEYVIHEGAGIRECIKMNAHQVQWKVADYVESFAAQGMESYIIVSDALRKYPALGLDPVLCALSGTGSHGCPAVKAGTYRHSPEHLELAQMALEYLNSLMAYKKSFRGRTWIFCLALLYCYGMDNVDKGALYAQLVKYKDTPSLSVPFVKIHDALQMIETIYNHNRSTRLKVNIVAQYNDMIRQNRKWWDGIETKKKKKCAA